MKQDTINAPLTDPADFWTLIGRFVTGIVLNLFLVWSLTKQSWWSVALFAITSIIVHRATIGLYKRLRSERVEKKLILRAEEQEVNK